MLVFTDVYLAFYPFLASAGVFSQFFLGTLCLVLGLGSCPLPVSLLVLGGKVFVFALCSLCAKGFYVPVTLLFLSGVIWVFCMSGGGFCLG